MIRELTEGAATCSIVTENLSPSAARLREEASFIAGLVPVQVEERVHPLWLRAGTDDVEQAIAALDLHAGGLKFPHEPQRIIELGAGSGFRSVALASEYPGAEILSLEADPAVQRVALLNTLGYDAITYLTQAVGVAEANYGFFGRNGPKGRLALTKHPAGPIKSKIFQHVLQFHRFTDADTLVITPDAASLPILAQPLPSGIRLIAVETGGLPLPAEIARGFPLTQFVTIISGNYVLLYRRSAAAAPAPPRPVAVFAPDGPARFLRLENVQPGGFFALGGGGFRLQPNVAGAPPARLTLSVENRAYAELQLALRLVLENAPAVRFGVKIVTEAGTVLAAGGETFQGAAARIMILKLPAHHGRCEVSFTTELAEPGASTPGAWAEIISATLI